ncbi:heterokaryon incompatibility protein-domain-containing protein [Xylariaceae sp. AK1471]|nr:heterokaryon incompatibility protein-domain-containing protein [Xylariaceae sp. AK1471]
MDFSYDTRKDIVGYDMRPRRLAHLSRGSTHLCARCREINVVKLTAPGGYQHYDDPLEMVNSSMSCPLCERFILRPQAVTFNRSHADATGPLFCSLIGKAGLKRLQLSTASTQSPEIGVMRGIESGRLLSLGVFAIVGDPAEDYGIAVRRQLTNTSSASSMRIAREWLSTCLTEHRCSHYIKSSRTAELLRQRPSRLLDLRAFNDNPLDIKLVEGMNVSEYVTLSHCWGPDHSSRCTTTTQNLAERASRISFQDLPRTFQDAATIARELGFRYLWIDALCILQGCEEDWAKEGSKMEAIFSNCVLCISATSGVDGTSGCFTLNSLGRQNLEPHLIEITSTLTTGETSSLFVYCDEPVTDEPGGLYSPNVIRTSPVASRGWMCQERILPPRILHFTSEQLIWECGDGFQSEDGLESWSQSVDPLGPKPTDKESGPILARKLANMDSQDSPFETTLQWYNLISSDYSKRQLSFAQDKLAAISGLARLVARSTGSRYIAGLWEFGLCYGLCWSVNAPAPLVQSEVYRSPSFSWAATDSQVSWQPMLFDVDRGPPSSLFTILAWKSWPSTSDEYGRVERCALKVAGQIKKVTVTPSPAKPWPNDYNATLRDHPYSRAWVDVHLFHETSMLAMLICNIQQSPPQEEWTTYAILLKLVQREKAVFKRIGIADFCDESFKDCPTKTIFLI